MKFSLRILGLLNFSKHYVLVAPEGGWCRQVVASVGGWFRVLIAGGGWRWLVADDILHPRHGIY